MTNDGGRANEPTSYGLRPPRPGPQQPPVPEQPAVPRQYEPTQEVGGDARPESGAGRLLGGRYRLVDRLGHGGMGTVWRAHDEVVDREVAVKEPRVPDHLGERERNTVHLRMQREARAAARIDHPSVVTMHDVVVEDGKPWIVMELVRGHSLADRLQEGTLDVREAARIGLAVLGALSAAHEAGVLHRDVKPANVLLGRGDRVVLTDFGIAQVEGEQGLTETGAFVGSPEYIAPERVLGQRPGPESDLWSLGVVLYAAVEGVSPYRRSNTPATLQAVLSAEPQIPARGSGAFGTLVMQLLRKDPAARPGPAEIRQTLESVAHPAPASLAATRLLADAGAAEGLRAWVPPVLARSRRARYGLGGGALAVAAALVLVLVQPFRSEGLPSGWQVRPENEVLNADVAVPGDYRRVQSDKTDALWYYDPSGIFEIDFWRTDTDSDKEAIGGSAAAWEAHYKEGGDQKTEMRDAEVDSSAVKFQGKDATELVTDFTPYSTSTSVVDPYRFTYYELLVPGKGSVYWRMRVKAPADGQAAKDGAKLFAQVRDGLKIRDL
ncbi:serine/threonine-protein kinase [Streptomyces sp. TLI_146]|uniref:serine/threonine-protein kinase n=1 Tax=Streptomyces sp. TLI_146 TaxID=1938858 RepID=UPI000C6FEB79|nr:serine/threonine-protein kinase [Streptomyces sp. TLI_146]PKV87362.1 serine/threonine protein kinase [Streptomyces sp. TLI_146]